MVFLPRLFSSSQAVIFFLASAVGRSFNDTSSFAEFDATPSPSKHSPCEVNTHTSSPFKVINLSFRLSFGISPYPKVELMDNEGNGLNEPTTDLISRLNFFANSKSRVSCP